MKEPTWGNVKYGPIDDQHIIYYAAPKQRASLQSLDDVDPEIRRTFEKLGIPLEERQRLGGDHVQGETGGARHFLLRTVQNHPDLVRKYLGTVVPYSDNFFATLNSAVFSDGCSHRHPDDPYRACLSGRTVPAGTGETGGHCGAGYHGREGGCRLGTAVGERMSDAAKLHLGMF